MLSPLTCSCSSALPQVTEVSFIPSVSIRISYLDPVMEKRLTSLNPLPRICRCRPTTAWWIPAEDRRWVFPPLIASHSEDKGVQPSFLCSPSAELLKKEKIIVDCKVYMFAMGMAQAFFKPRELPVLKQWGWTKARDHLCCCTRVPEI